MIVSTQQIEQLQDPHPKRRFEASEGLASYDGELPTALREVAQVHLTSALLDAEIDVRVNALKALSRFDHLPPPTEELVWLNLHSCEGSVSFAAQGVLSKIRYSASSFAESWKEAVNMGDMDLLSSHLHILDAVDSLPLGFAPILEEALGVTGKHSYDVRWEATELVGKLDVEDLGDQGRDSLEQALVECARTGCNEMRELVGTALQHIGIDGLSKYRWLDPEVEDAGAYEIETEYDPESDVPMENAHLQHPEALLDRMIETGEIDPLAMFTLTFESEEPIDVPKYVEPVIELSRKLEGTSDSPNMISILSTLEQQSDHPTKALDRIIERLEESDDPEERYFACFAFRYLGARAEKAMPALRSALDDSDPEVRQGARAALQAIRRDLME